MNERLEIASRLMAFINPHNMDDRTFASFEKSVKNAYGDEMPMDEAVSRMCLASADNLIEIEKQTRKPEYTGEEHLPPNLFNS